MLLTTLRTAVWHYPRSVLETLGLFWLLIESVISLSGTTIDLTYWQFFGLSASVGFLWLLINGFWVSGFFKQIIEIKSNGFDTKIVVKFGDIFQQDGWKSIAVNDFFDSVVDDRYVASRSLHGILLQKYWPGNIDDWNRQADAQLAGDVCTEVERNGGKQNRYKIGTTIAARKDGEKFLCVALARTDISNLESRASASDLLAAVRGLLQKARSICANEPLSIPLFGSGLSRVGIKNCILVDLILTAIFEETKIGKVTDEIRIVLPKEKSSGISLAALQRNWS